MISRLTEKYLRLLLFINYAQTGNVVEIKRLRLKRSAKRFAFSDVVIKEEITTQSLELTLFRRRFS